MTQVKSADGKDVLRLWLSPGETVTLAGDRGSITFDGVTGGPACRFGTTPPAI